MASLLSLQGRGGGRIPLGNGTSLSVSRHMLAEIIEAMPDAECHAMHQAVRYGDTATAQRLLREAAASYCAAPLTPGHTPTPHSSQPA